MEIGKKREIFITIARFNFETKRYIHILKTGKTNSGKTKRDQFRKDWLKRFSKKLGRQSSLKVGASKVFGRSRIIINAKIFFQQKLSDRFADNWKDQTSEKLKDQVIHKRERYLSKKIGRSFPTGTFFVYSCKSRKIKFRKK